ncbi:hypothetical protein M3P21_09400 [Ruegeria sp. 2012CJ41-6]|uniref:Tellurite resistance protein TerB n=1 Tax=Ruegeria spongiae TaxID=2942209 RepID=A0ABT0Q2T8_9RHOB|nr:hypothetical protein [Ruegeria spongiae]MCL6283742.1 hypothetical protein [Ruegeria spongiae]
MPLVILILTAVGGAIWWWVRNNPREAINTAHDVATTLKNAPRRLAFRSVANAHPVEGIDDERIAICAIAQSFIELDDLPTSEQRQQLHVLLRSKLRCSEEEAKEMEVLGRWLMTQCNGPADAVPRLGRRLRKLDAARSWAQLQEILMPLVGEQLSSAQIQAIEDIKFALKVR